MKKDRDKMKVKVKVKESDMKRREEIQKGMKG